MKTPFLKTLAIAILAISASFSASAVDLSQFSQQEVAEIVTMCENDPSSVGLKIFDSFEDFSLSDKADIDEGTAEFGLFSATSELNSVCEFNSNDAGCD